MTASQVENHTPTDVDEDDISFGVSADGFPVARIGDTTLAMVPTADGSLHFLASA